MASKWYSKWVANKRYTKQIDNDTIIPKIKNATNPSTTLVGVTKHWHSICTKMYKE